MPLGGSMLNSLRATTFSGMYGGGGEELRNYPWAMSTTLIASVIFRSRLQMLEEGKGHPSKRMKWERAHSPFSREMKRGVFSWFIPWELGQGIAWSLVVLPRIPVTLFLFFSFLIKEICVFFFSFKLYQRQLLPSLRAYFDLSLSWKHSR